LAFKIHKSIFRTTFNCFNSSPNIKHTIAALDIPNQMYHISSTNLQLLSNLEYHSFF